MKENYEEMLNKLSCSKFRSKFYLNDKDKTYIQAKGIDLIKSHANDFIETRLKDSFPKNDGKQTPMRGHPVFIAQHATATCCRGCLQKWHGIEKGRVLSAEEVEYIVNLIMFWIKNQMES